MRMKTGVIAASLLLSAFVAVPSAARSEDSPDDSTSVWDAIEVDGDSLEVSGDQDTAAAGGEEERAGPWISRLKPDIKAFIKTDSRAYKMGSASRMSWATGGNWNFSSSLVIEKKNYRNQDIEELTESFSNTATNALPGVYSLSINAGETYTKKKTFGFGRFGKDLIFENERISARMLVSKPLISGAATQISVSAGAMKGLNDFKYDRKASGGLGGFVRFKPAQKLSIGGGVGISGMVESSSVENIVFGGMPSQADTVRLRLEYGEGQKKPFEVKYDKRAGKERKVEPPRGNSQEILDDPEAANREEITRLSEKTEMRSYIEPISDLSLDVSFSHEVNTDEYLENTSLSRGSEKTVLKAAASYNYAKDGNVKVTLSKSENKSESGANPASSYSEGQDIISAQMSQKISETVMLRARGALSLRQRFYKYKNLNPRDADYPRLWGEVNLSSKPFPRIKADVGFNAERYEVINISSTVSGDNRVDYLYKLRPSINIRAAHWVTVEQNLEIKMEYTDFLYGEDRNTLDRTISMNTRGSFRAFNTLSVSIEHRYTLRDNGSYLMREGERRYGRLGENKKNKMYLSLRYDPIRDLSLGVVSQFMFEEKNRLSAGEVTSSAEYESGGIKYQVKRKRKIGDFGDIELDINYVRNYGPYVSKERKEYWEVDSSMNVRF